MLTRTLSFLSLAMVLHIAVVALPARAEDSAAPLSSCGTVSGTGVQEVKCPLSLFAGRAPVDILWVVDNSPSMEQHQQNLVNNTSVFINQLIGGNAPQWQLGLISTDSSNDPFLGFTPSTIVNYQTPTATAIQTFQSAVLSLGTAGSGTEQAYEPIIRAITPNILFNPSETRFLRPEANLAIIVLTDADEQSSFLTDTNAFLNYIAGKKGGNLKRVAGFGIMAALDLPDSHGNPCPTEEESHYHGGRYEDFITRTGGKVFSLCDASPTMFADIMKAVLSTVLGNRLHLGIPHLDLSSLRLLDAKRVLKRGPAAQGGDWDYDVVKDDVVFTDMTKIEGDHIQVVYRLL